MYDCLVEYGVFAGDLAEQEKWALEKYDSLMECDILSLKQRDYITKWRPEQDF